MFKCLFNVAADLWQYAAVKLIYGFPPAKRTPIGMRRTESSVLNKDKRSKAY